MLIDVSSASRQACLFWAISLLFPFFLSSMDFSLLYSFHSLRLLSAAQNHDLIWRSLFLASLGFFPIALLPSGSWSCCLRIYVIYRCSTFGFLYSRSSRRLWQGYLSRLVSGFPDTRTFLLHGFQGVFLLGIGWCFLLYFLFLYVFFRLGEFRAFLTWSTWHAYLSEIPPDFPCLSCLFSPQCSANHFAIPFIFFLF